MTLSRDPAKIARDQAATLRAIRKALDPNWRPKRHQKPIERYVTQCTPIEIETIAQVLSVDALIAADRAARARDRAVARLLRAA